MTGAKSGLLAIIFNALKVLWSPIKWLYRALFLYPVEIIGVSQWETRVGYVLVVSIKARGKYPVFIPKSAFGIRLNKDKQILKDANNKKVMFGEYLEVYDSEPVLIARIRGLSYGNVPRHVTGAPTPANLWLLVRVRGPGSQNPSARLQLARLYMSVTVTLTKRLIPRKYAVIPIRHVSIIAGNEKTKIVDA